MLMTGWNVPLYTLLHKELISRNDCPYTRSLSNFFSGGSCVPGVLTPENNPTEDSPQLLCSICAGNLDVSGNTVNTPKLLDVQKSFAGPSGRSPADITVSNLTGGMDVCCECCVLPGRGLCDGPITLP